MGLNVIVDLVQQRQPFYEESARVVDAVVRGQAVGWLAAHSITTLFYVINRVRNRETAVTAITGLLDVFTVAAVDDQVIRQALAWGWPDFEDAVQMAAAVQAQADYLITRNPAIFSQASSLLSNPLLFSLYSIRRGATHFLISKPALEQVRRTCAPSHPSF